MKNFKLQFPVLYQTLTEEKTQERLFAMSEEIIKFNGKINLVSPSTIANIESVHFLDSVLGAQLILKDTPFLELYDVGSGNGFPGLILASLDAQRSIKLVESDKRKAEFIEHCAFKMKLSNVEIICARVENLNLSHPALFVSRAFSSIPKALDLYAKACPQGFEAYHFKSLHWEREIIKPPVAFTEKNVPCGTNKLGDFYHKVVGKYQLPHNGQDFFIIRSTPRKMLK
ncbi:MAG: hypothetical protein HAW63_05245 [Bdellovibrionaceae bacterium]|nr:hypothetical protein [Pseudobdellovibrionaceae bacterium]